MPRRKRRGRFALALFARELRFTSSRARERRVCAEASCAPLPSTASRDSIVSARRSAAAASAIRSHLARGNDMTRSRARLRLFAAPALACVVLPIPASPQAAAHSAATGQRAATVPLASVDPALFKALRYRMVGPNRGGRVTAVTGVASEPATFYMGVASGGVWKT